MVFTQAYKLSKKLEDEIQEKNTHLLDKCSVNKYILFLKEYPKLEDYNYISPDVRNFCKTIIQHSDEYTLEVYHRLLLAKLIIENEVKLSEKQLPDDVRTLFVQNFKRIVDSINSAGQLGEYLYPNDIFVKKLAVCCLKLIPVGARKINQSILPVKNFMFKKGVKQLADLTLHIMIELKGIKPFYTGHLDTNDPDLVSELNETGLIKAYARIARLLKINTNIKGYFGTSWMLDPQLDRINLRHQYHRKLVVQNGGKLYYQGPSKAAMKNALMKSKTRRKLYQEGKYVPTSYVIIWPRQKLIRWAEQYGLI